MTTHKKFLVTGSVFIILPIVVLIADSALLNCNSSFRFLPSIVGALDNSLDISWLVAFFLIPIGVTLLIFAYIRWQRGRGISKVAVSLEVLGILFLLVLCASLFLSSLNTARNKGPNAEVKSQLSILRAQAEVYYDSNSSSYEGVCTSSPEIVRMLDVVKIGKPKPGLLCSESINDTLCISDGQSYAVSTKLPQKEFEEYFCVDSTGFAGQVSEMITGAYCTPSPNF